MVWFPVDRIGTLFGISEELMFRGIILQSLLKTQTIQRRPISALAFSSSMRSTLLPHHSVLLLRQLATTFIFGLFAASSHPPSQ